MTKDKYLILMKSIVNLSKNTQSGYILFNLDVALVQGELT